MSNNLTLKSGELVFIESGEFEMGDSRVNPTVEASPAHRVFVDSYYIDRLQVTNAQFRDFCNDTGYVTTAEWLGYGDVYRDGEWVWEKCACWCEPLGAGSDIEDKLDHPVVLVTVGDALAYCRWRTDKEGRVFRLPTEAEWEKAARGDKGTLYPWGDGAIDDGGVQRARYNDGIALGTAPVGSYDAGASPYGVLDMAGNAWDWCLDAFKADYYRRAPKSDRGGPLSLSGRSPFRGGSWVYPQDYQTTIYRHRNRIARPSAGIGFRTVCPVRDSLGIRYRIALRRVVHTADKRLWRFRLHHPGIADPIGRAARRFGSLLARLQTRQRN